MNNFNADSYIFHARRAEPKISALAAAEAAGVILPHFHLSRGHDDARQGRKIDFYSCSSDYQDFQRGGRIDFFFSVKKPRLSPQDMLAADDMISYPSNIIPFTTLRALSTTEIMTSLHLGGSLALNTV